MAKWFKRALLLTAILLMVLIALAGIGLHYVRETPDFYRAYEWDSQQRSIVNQRAVNKLASAHNLAAKARADERAIEATVRTQAPPPGRTPAQPLSLAFTEEEINAFLIHNLELVPAVKSKVGQHVADPGIYLQDGQIILAAKAMDMAGAVVSLHFRPALDQDGRLRMELAETRAGRLPLPRALVDRMTHRILTALQAKMPQWQQAATMDAAGGSNSEAAAAAMGQLLLSILRGDSAEPVLFVPVDEKGTSVPLRLADLQIKGDTLMLTLSPMSRQQRQAVFDRVRLPLATPALTR